MKHKRNRTKHDKIIDALEKVNNIEKHLYESLLKTLEDDNTLPDNVTGIVIKIRGILNIYKSINANCIEYWKLRGWSDIDSYKMAYKQRTTLKGKKSPFNYKFWIDKGMDESDAIIKANSIRPICKEYWIEKGLSELDAMHKAQQVKESNNKKGAMASSTQDVRLKRIFSKRCLEYWIHNGYEYDEAVLKLGEHQRTFSLDLCVKKYGHNDGNIRWKDRQEKWLNTLSEKSNIEILIINHKKSRAHKKTFQNNKFYVIEMIDQYNNYYIKVGVTCKQIFSRYSKHISDGWKISILKLIDNIDCYKLEQRLLLDLHNKDFLPVKKFDGYTECFPIDMKLIILNYVDEYINEFELHPKRYI